MPRRGKVHVGTSGWTYDHWLGRFYPRETKGESRLHQYARAFGSVEINASFYRLPTEKAMQGWLRDTPKDFVFSAKASRYLSHMKRLKDPDEHVPIFTDRIRAMRPKLGPLLVQLPPKFSCDIDRLRAFCDALPKGFRWVFELRHESWWTDEVWKLLRKRRAAFCLFHLDGRETPEVVTAGFVYIRLHGPGAAYKGSYSDKVLHRWRDRIGEWRGKGKDVFIYFDNDEKAYATEDALRLQEMLD